MKNFEDDFYRLLKLLKIREPFAFNRFSDGELYILQNKELILDSAQVKVGQNVTEGIYQSEDFKRFHPEEHSFYRDRLVEAFKFKKRNYFKGLSCRCCVGNESFQWQLDFHGKYDRNFTWANLLVNGNYPKFIHEMYPVFNTYKTVFVCNENADLSVLPFLVKDFRVGYNAMVQDYGLIEGIKSWINENNIKGHLFLFSASSFSKMAIHQLYEFCDRNTYIDVGTTLNPFMDMRIDRTYLKSFWLGAKGSDISKICIW
ncbi:MAG: hypothetical protein SRB1_01049 [Desulfobacteraceae bacterium Eth-SRB1]|nr:MAG: hypothetical protein SRB1_01049 [Desulfobacteraceae bacterium Eth-SRB1]